MRHRPAALSELTYYWSYCILWTLLGLTFRDRPTGRGWKERVKFFRAEFHDVRSRTADARDRPAVLDVEIRLAA